MMGEINWMQTNEFSQILKREMILGLDVHREIAGEG
jgi:hypothetical protein